MNRLWIRLSLMVIGAYCVIVIPVAILPSLANLYLHIIESNAAMTSDMMAAGAAATDEQQMMTPEGSMAAEEQMMLSTFVAQRLVEISTELYRVVIFGSIIGICAGIWASWRLSKPIRQLEGAADAVRRRDFSHRVDQKKWAKELASLADTFNNMAADLDQAEKLRRQLITDVAHELRTPLTVLAGNLNAALDRVYELSEEEFANLYIQTNYLIRLVNDLHELSQAEARQLPLDIKPVDVAGLVQETVALFEVLAEEKAIELICELPPTPLIAPVDAVRIRQVLHNLISNGLVHTPDGGTIIIRAKEIDGTIELAVQDSGSGIEPEHLEQIFNRFYRTDRARTRNTGGSGLGLTIVRALVEAHGGWVSAQSAGTGQGSIFTIALPTAGSAPQTHVVGA